MGLDYLTFINVTFIFVKITSFYQTGEREKRKRKKDFNYSI